MSKAKMKRKEKYPPNGAATPSNRTPEEQLKWLDQKGFRAVKERARLIGKILLAATNKTVTDDDPKAKATMAKAVDSTLKQFDRWARTHPPKQSDIKALQNKIRNE